MFKPKFHYLFSVALIVMLVAVAAPANASAKAELESGTAVYWCPAGINPGGAGCSIGFSDLATLANELTWIWQPKQDGTIWIKAGDDASTGNIVFNGTDTNIWAQHALTIQGGWDGKRDARGTISGVSSFKYVISVGSWKGDVISNDVFFTSAGSPASLVIFSSGNIKLNDVHVSDPAATGADLDNSGGTGSIEVNNSLFRRTGSGSDGLHVRSSGAVSLTDVVIYAASGHGAYINNSFGSGAPVTINGGAFTGGANGLQILSAGNVTLNSLFADSSGLIGASIDNTFTLGYGVTVTHSQFAANGTVGLNIRTGGNVSLSNVFANDNRRYLGAYIDASPGGGAVNVDASEFNANTAGMYVDSHGGITIKCSSVQNNNPGLGLSANAPGAVTLSGVTFSGNTGGDRKITGGGSFSIVAGDCPPKGGGSPVRPDPDGELVLINCTNPDPFTATLPNGAAVSFGMLCGFNEILLSKSQDALPAALPDGWTFNDALDVRVFDGAAPIDPLPQDASITVSFPLQGDGNFAILHWTGQSWEQLAGTQAADGTLQLQSVSAGLFVLVSNSP